MREKLHLIAYPLFIAFSLGVGLLVCWVFAAHWSDRYGFAGVVGFKAEGMDLTCGGHYQPQDAIIFHPTLPCGHKVTLINPANGQSTKAIVASQKVMFGENSARVADMSPAVAVALGLNPHSLVAHKVILRTEFGNAPVISHMLADFSFKSPQDLDKSELSILTRNMLGECGGCGIPGMVAVAQVTQNRADQGFNGHHTLEGVVRDPSQFSWITLNPGLKGTRGNYNTAKNIASLFMLERLSGDALAVQYMVTSRATYFYAYSQIKAPSWTRRANIRAIPLPARVEAELKHRFYGLAEQPQERQLASK